MRATTVIKDPTQDVEVTVVVSGMMPNIALDLSSDPALSNQEIASLIATGRPDVALDSSAWIVGEQAGALLPGRFTRAVARQLIDLGLDQVDIQPELLAREGNPSARFTFGKQLTPALRLIYSTGLSNPEEQYYQAQFGFRLGQQITFKLQRRFDGSYQYGAGQRLRFGGPPRPQKAATTYAPVELRDVQLEGELARVPGPPRRSPRRVPARRSPTGTSWTTPTASGSTSRTRGTSRPWSTRASTTTSPSSPGWRGCATAGGSRAWTTRPTSTAMTSALFEEEAMDKAREALLEELRRRGHLKANVEVETRMEGGYHVMVFKAEPGPVLTADASFPGRDRAVAEGAAGRGGRRARADHAAARRGGGHPPRLPQGPAPRGQGGADAHRRRSRAWCASPSPSRKGRRRRSPPSSSSGATAARGGAPRRSPPCPRADDTIQARSIRRCYGSATTT